MSTKTIEVELLEKVSKSHLKHIERHDQAIDTILENQKIIAAAQNQQRQDFNALLQHLNLSLQRREASTNDGGSTND